MTPVHRVICVRKWLIWFYAVLLSFDTLMMVRCGPKNVGILSVVL